MRIARAVENACAITRLTEPIAAEDADEVAEISVTPAEVTGRISTMRVTR